MPNPLDPPEGNWWDNPVNRREAMWLGIAGVWSLGIFGWMTGYTRFGDQNPIGETFQKDEEEFEERFQTYREEAETIEIDGTEALVPPDGSVYIRGQRFRWHDTPFALEAGREYDIHLTSDVVQHGFSVRPEGSLSQQINLQIFPDKEWVLPMTFEDPDTYHIICNEFCGSPGHSGMHDRFFVREEL